MPAHNPVTGGQPNSALGIDLNGDGVTPNHMGFLPGPNDLQNYPVITNITVLGNTTTVYGTLNAVPNNRIKVCFQMAPRDA